MIRALLALLLLAAPVQAADAPRPGVMRANGFDLVAFFEQPTRGRGRSIAVNGVERWTVTTRSEGTEPAGFRMLETLAYDDGDQRLQDWTIRLDRFGDGYVATRPDLKGTATFRPAGPGRLVYTWQFFLDAERLENLVTLQGNLTLRPDNSVLNAATVWKWAVPIGRVRVEFNPVAR